MHKRKGGPASLREIVFGLEDSIVSTLGAITGIAVGSHNADLVLLSGAVIVVVEAISMSAGSYLSTKSEYELMGRLSPSYSPLRASVVMLCFYFVGGCIPLIPYLLLDLSQALYVAIALGGTALFSLGVWKGIVVGRPPLKSGLEMLIVSFVAAMAGYIIGSIAPAILG